MTTITTQDALIEKLKAEADINAIIYAFEKKTGLMVSYIPLFRNEQSGEQQPDCKLDVRL